MMGWMDASEALAVCGTDRRPAMGNHGSTRGTRRQVRETRTRAGCRGHAVRATREWSRGRARGWNTRVPVASGKSRTCTDADVRLEEGEARAAPAGFTVGSCRRDELRPGDFSECNSAKVRGKRGSNEGLSKIFENHMSKQSREVRSGDQKKKKKLLLCFAPNCQPPRSAWLRHVLGRNMELSGRKKTPAVTARPSTRLRYARVARGRDHVSPPRGAHRLDRLVHPRLRASVRRLHGALVRRPPPRRDAPRLTRVTSGNPRRRRRRRRRRRPLSSTLSARRARPGPRRAFRAESRTQIAVARSLARAEAAAMSASSRAAVVPRPRRVRPAASRTASARASRLRG